MIEKNAKKQLELMLDTLTAGSILHLLADVFRESAEQASDALLQQQLKQVEEALYVVGLGVDLACPRSTQPRFPPNSTTDEGNSP